MPTCFAPRCSSGYLSAVKRNKETGQRNPSLFSAPKDAKRVYHQKYEKNSRDNIQDAVDELRNRMPVFQESMTRVSQRSVFQEGANNIQVFENKEAEELKKLEIIEQEKKRLEEIKNIEEWLMATEVYASSCPVNADEKEMTVEQEIKKQKEIENIEKWLMATEVQSPPEKKPAVEELVTREDGSSSTVSADKEDMSREGASSAPRNDEERVQLISPLLAIENYEDLTISQLIRRCTTKRRRTMR